MGLIYSSAIGLFGALAVPKYAALFSLNESEKTQDGGSQMNGSTVLAMLGKFQAVTKFRVITETFLAVPAACCSLTSCSKIVRNVAISI